MVYTTATQRYVEKLHSSKGMMTCVRYVADVEYTVVTLFEALGKLSRARYVWRRGTGERSEASRALDDRGSLLVLLVVEVGANVNTGGERVLGLEHQ